MSETIPAHVQVCVPTVSYSVNVCSLKGHDYHVSEGGETEFA